MKKAIMKQNKNTSSVRVASAALAAFVFFFSLCVPSFAYTDTSTNGVDFSAGSIGVLANIDVAKASYSSLPDITFTQGNYVWKPVIVNASSSFDVYCFKVGFYIYVAFDSSYYSTSLRLNAVTSDSSFSTEYVNLTDSTNNLNYGGFGSVGFTSTANIPDFSSLSDGLAAVRDWIDNPGGGGAPHSLSLTVPAGNAVYIDVTGVSTVRATLSMTSEVAHPLHWVSNQYYGWANQYPASIAGNPTGSTAIPWTGYGNKTLFNRYQSFSWTLTSVGSSNYLFICNPYASIDEYDQSFNPTIYVSLDEAVGYKYYQLTGGVGSDGTIGQQSDGTTASGSYNPDTGQWSTLNDETGLPWTPSEGGGNIITQNSINSWLQTISTQIGNFFSGAIGAVTTLVSSGSEFIHSLSSLYAWLPAPVYAVLTSALILVITIGVIKVFI